MAEETRRDEGNTIPLHTIRQQRSTSSNSIPFPTPREEDDQPQFPEPSSSNITSSDKLSALPINIQSSPGLGRLRQSPNPRSFRRPSGSLPSLESSSPAKASFSTRPQPSASRASEPSVSPGTQTPPRQRVSFESDRASLPATLQNLRQVLAGRSPTSRADSCVASPGSLRSAESPNPKRPIATSLPSSPLRDGARTPASPTSASPDQSRAASPIRQWLGGLGLHRGHSRDEPFVPIDPFQMSFRFFSSPSSTPRRQSLDLSNLDLHCEDAACTCLPLPVNCSQVIHPKTKKTLRRCGAGFSLFFLDTLPRQVYLHLLLRLPALYFSRVARIYEDAEVSKQEIHRLIEACSAPDHDHSEDGLAAAVGHAVNTGAAVAQGPAQGIREALRGQPVLPYPEEWSPPHVSPSLVRFKLSWEAFVDSLLREWKTLNLVSALLCTAILTMFQIPDAAGDPLTRWAALFSLIFSLCSLTYGCIYIVQFGTMRSMPKASRWASESQKTRTYIWWNVWVLLAMPAAWLAWSMLAFCIAIISYVWRTGSAGDPQDGVYAPLTNGEAAAVRGVLSAVFVVGMVFFVMILRTFGRYGERELAWDRRRSWMRSAPRPRRTSEDAVHGRERERGRARDRERGRGNEGTPVMGLGLIGVSPSESGTGMTSVAGVLASEGSYAKKNKDAFGNRSKASPRL